MKRKAEETMQSISHLELFNCTHRRKKGKGQYVDKKSEIVSGKYKQVLEKKYGSDSTSLLDFDARSWCEVTEGQMKGRLYGFGDRFDDMPSKNSSGATSSPCMTSS